MTLSIKRLGSTGVDVSEIALGALTFGPEADEAASAKILRAYLDAGGNFIDTADAYGRSEEVLASLLKAITCSGGRRSPWSRPSTPSSSAAWSARSCRSVCVRGSRSCPGVPLGGGLLSSKYRGADRASVDTRAGSLSNSTATVRRRLANDRNQAIAENARQIAARIGRSAAQRRSR
jgi:aryl-alcohol dehydrogenase-like predicted oxidoreductase